SGPATADSTRSASDTGATTAENRLLAAAASKAAISALPLPDGSVQLAGEPAGWPVGGMGLGPYADPKLTDTAWWSVPADSDGLADYLADHAPPGMHHTAGEDAVSGADSSGVAWTDYVPIEPADPAAYIGPDLLLEFK